jgi:hypothetical protein
MDLAHHCWLWEWAEAYWDWRATSRQQLARKPGLPSCNVEELRTANDLE